MIRVTSATHRATCIACRDKDALNLTEPCSQHLAAELGGHIVWQPIPPTAWDRALAHTPAPSWEQALAQPTNDPWEGFR